MFTDLPIQMSILKLKRRIHFLDVNFKCIGSPAVEANV